MSTHVDTKLWGPDSATPKMVLSQMYAYCWAALRQSVAIMTHLRRQGIYEDFTDFLSSPPWELSTHFHFLFVSIHKMHRLARLMKLRSGNGKVAKIYKEYRPMLEHYEAGRHFWEHLDERMPGERNSHEISARDTELFQIDEFDILISDQRWSFEAEEMWKLWQMFARLNDCFPPHQRVIGTGGANIQWQDADPQLFPGHSSSDVPSRD